jgi:hypothetical protein
MFVGDTMVKRLASIKYCHIGMYLSDCLVTVITIMGRLSINSYQQSPWR